MTNSLRIAVRQFGPFESAIRKQWDSFSMASGAKQRLEAVPLHLHALYQTLFARKGLFDGSWDIAFVPTDWIAEANEVEALTDLTAYLEERPPDNYPEGWSESLLRFQKFGDKTIALPYHDGPECLIYRTDLFEELHLDVPVTWPEFYATAREISQRKPGIAGNILAGYPDGHNTVYDFCLQLWTRGGELFDRAGHLSLETPQAEWAL
ncbi:MAG: extracellular solute-binding protein, partial [Verrucomicrobia bacterium]|nr:extracellular solute-binding protein [Verrucomicrobiota bacterium]